MAATQDREDALWSMVLQIAGSSVELADGRTLDVLVVDETQRSFQLRFRGQTETDPIEIRALDLLCVLLYRSGRLTNTWMAEHCRETLGWRQWGRRGEAVLAFLPHLDPAIESSPGEIRVAVERPQRPRTLRRLATELDTATEDSTEPEPEPEPDPDPDPEPEPELLDLSEEELAKRIWQVAKDWLLADLGEERFTQEVQPPAPGRPDTWSKVYRALMESIRAQASLRRHVGDLNRIVGPLAGFDPATMRQEHRNTVERLHAALLRLQPRAVASNRNVVSTWERFSRSAMSAAEYLMRFDSVDRFTAYVDRYHAAPDTCPGLPFLLAHEVHGYGYGPACDFLNAIGYPMFCCPSSHATDVLSLLRPVSGGIPELARQVAIIAAHAGVSARSMAIALDLIGRRRVDGVNTADVKRQFVVAVRSGAI